MTTDELRQKIVTEQTTRDEFVEKANQEIVFRNGRIAMLQELLAASEAADAIPDTAP